MSKLTGLILNENMKIYRRWATWVMMGLLVVAIGLTGIIQKYAMEPAENRDWQADLRASIERNEQMVQQERAPDAVKDQLREETAIMKYRLEQNIPPAEEQSLWGFMNTTVVLTSLISLFTIIAAAGSVAGEFSWGTIKLLLIRPVSRSKILLSKYVSTLIFALSLLVLLFVISFVAGSVLFGFGGLSQPHLVFSDGQVEERSMILHVLFEYGLDSINLLMMATFAFMISAVFRSSSLAIGLAMFLMFTGTQVVILLSQYSWAKYILFANTDLSQYLSGEPLVEGMTLGFSIGMLFVYFVLFNAVTWWIFNKRDIAA